MTIFGSAALVLFHTALSLIAIATGLVVVRGRVAKGMSPFLSPRES
jgi:hypothetical protein